MANTTTFIGSVEVDIISNAHSEDDHHKDEQLKSSKFARLCQKLGISQSRLEMLKRNTSVRSRSNEKRRLSTQEERAERRAIEEWAQPRAQCVHLFAA